MTANRPYLVRALHDWISDNDCTPYLLVDATAEDVLVPSEHVDDGRIVLNISHHATDGLMLGNDEITFNARFSGRPLQVRVPLTAVLAIYARENGQGMMFPPENAGEPPPEAPEPPTGSRPTLKVVK